LGPIEEQVKVGAVGACLSSEFTPVNLVVENLLRNQDLTVLPRRMHIVLCLTKRFDTKSIPIKLFQSILFQKLGQLNIWQNPTANSMV
jgi:hypothetical protein